MKLTDEGLLVGLPCEVADVQRQPSAAGVSPMVDLLPPLLEGADLVGALSSRTVMLRSPRVTWSVLGVKIDGSASCWMF